MTSRLKMAEGIDLSVPVENVTDLDSEMSAIRSDQDYGKGSQTIGGNPRSASLQDRLEKLYSRKYPETGARQAELPENKSLHDTIVKTGLQNPEMIEEEAEQGRDEIREQAAKREGLEAEGQLRQITGSETVYQETVSRCHYILDTFLKPEDSQRIIAAYGNDLDLVLALAKVAEKLGPLFDWEKEAKTYKRTKKGEK
jgi:hypothetical protein